VERFPIVIVKGGSFAKNCNRGAKLVDTDLVVFLNDDTRIEDAEEFFEEMAKMIKKYQIVGCRAEEGANGVRIEKGKIIHVRNNKDKVTYSAGHCVMMKIETFQKLKGYDEKFINGSEDLDLYMRAEKMGMKIGIFQETIMHLEGQSEDRYENITENVKEYNKRWGKKAKDMHFEITKKFKKIKKEEWIKL
jgi:GT2 family glycosyltransferase